MLGHHQSRGAPRCHPTHLAIWAAAAAIIRRWQPYPGCR